MGRPEWIVIAVVLSAGLIGALATAVANAWSAASDAPTRVSIDQGRLTTENKSTVTAEMTAETRTVAGIANVPIATLAGSDIGGGQSVLWLLGGGVIGLLLVAVIAVARYGGFPDRVDEERAGTTPARVPSSEDRDLTVNEDPSPDSAAIEDGPVADDRRVMELLEDGGGRLKQTAIVEETEWSKSKVSMLLSEMEDDGDIRKIQVGRENIIALEGHEPEAANSPFDDAE